MGLERAVQPSPPAVLEITATQRLNGEVLSFYVDAGSALQGLTLSELSFPEFANVMLIVRENDLVAPKGSTQLAKGDHVFVFCRPEHVRKVQRLLAGPSRTSRPPPRAAET